jgi:acyl-CoA thioesterase
MTDFTHYLENDNFAKHLGIQLLEVSEGYAKAKMEITENHKNGAGTVHGGAIFSLADFVFAMASNSHGPLAMAINVSISFFKAATSGTLFAESEEISLRSKLASYNIKIKNEKDELIAVFQGMVYRKKRE